MPKKYLVGCAGAFAAMLAVGGSARAQDFDQYCGLQGFAQPVRQTLIVLDENQLYAETGDQPDQRNAQWRHSLGSLLLTDEGTLEQSFLPRERISVVIARRDGTGLRQAFTGCLPLYSADEKRKISQGAGRMQSVNTFFGMGPIADAKKDMDLFRIRFGDSIKAALQPAVLSAPNLSRYSGTLETNNFVSSLKQGALVNFSYGIPRIFIFSDMSRFLAGFPVDRSKARQVGLDAGRRADIDLKDAEVYVVGLSPNPVARDALQPFFLASHGELVGAGSSIPSLAAPPAHVVFYQGLIRYPDNQFPIRIRLATDQNGTAVNSWLSVQTSREQYDPIHGVVTCQQNGNCMFTGDDVFAQVWNVSRTAGSDPSFDQALPFAGARTLTFVESGNTVAGAISDTLVRFQGVKGAKLEFSALRQPNARF